MKQVINNLNHEEIVTKGANALELWNEQYKDDLLNFFDKIYSKVIK